MTIQPQPPPLPPPGSLRCPRCSATIGPDQDWCLECGAPARTRLAQTPNWQLPTAAIAAIVLLAGAMLAFAFVRLTDDGDVPASAAPTAPATVTQPAATTPVPGTTTPIPGATTPVQGTTTPGTTVPVPGSTATVPATTPTPGTTAPTTTPATTPPPITTTTAPTATTPSKRTTPPPPPPPPPATTANP